MDLETGITPKSFRVSGSQGAFPTFPCSSFRKDKKLPTCVPVKASSGRWSPFSSALRILYTDEYVAVGRKRGDRHTAWSAARAEDSQLISNVSSNNNKNI